MKVTNAHNSLARMQLNKRYFECAICKELYDNINEAAQCCATSVRIKPSEVSGAIADSMNKQLERYSSIPKCSGCPFGKTESHSAHNDRWETTSCTLGCTDTCPLELITDENKLGYSTYICKLVADK